MLLSNPLINKPNLVRNYTSAVSIWHLYKW